VAKSYGKKGKNKNNELGIKYFELKRLPLPRIICRLWLTDSNDISMLYHDDTSQETIKNRQKG